jgi:hypothetical protein
MAAGLAVAATDIAGIDTVLSETNLKYTHVSGDFERFGKHIVSLEKDAPERQKIGRQNKEHVLKKYGIECLVNNVLAVTQQK